MFICFLSDTNIIISLSVSITPTGFCGGWIIHPLLPSVVSTVYGQQTDARAVRPYKLLITHFARADARTERPYKHTWLLRTRHAVSLQAECPY